MQEIEQDTKAQISSQPQLPPTNINQYHGVLVYAFPWNLSKSRAEKGQVNILINCKKHGNIPCKLGFTYNVWAHLISRRQRNEKN
jgi:hypothetical protein